MTIKAYVYDAYGTLFDVHSVSEKAESIFKGYGKTISEQWRKKQVEYFMLHQLTKKYKPFFEITRNALLYTLKNLSLQRKENEIDTLMQSYLELEVYDEVRDTLEILQKQNKKQIIFSNGNYEMLNPLVEKRELNHLLYVLSVDDIKQYKPAPDAYKYAQETLDVERYEILFMSSNFWDITGAASFGFKTAWINRGEMEVDELGIKPDFIFKDLHAITKI
ncbi:haloacid dehalogenase type II [Fictibacillus nanhaiensis]|uniref:haloacid dehalogenase type II n=1 Tax=Fictibacillus nanhaiensis TaxID=742169 RepID=UPI00203BB0C0|nr:haloacid dehalogenase type II [Fictibacillus nanhaiensis]MCM3732577.1 haloacid dehalogenase type II [Fictibacillus nanhaiensis]